MGFDLLPPLDSVALNLGGLRPEFLHKAGCSVCPLNKAPGNRSPNMQPSGSERPVVYMLGEAPGETEDIRDEPFVGKAGQLLRRHVPSDWLPDIRFNNVVRSRPPNNRDPSDIEIECCRPSVIADIERTKPRAIFGFGNVPLKWALNRSMVSAWRGRRAPVRIGQHTCWFFPMLHPSYVLHKESEFDGRQIAFVFEFDLDRAFSIVENLPDPVVYTREDIERDVAWVTGHGKNDLDRVIAHIEAMYDEEFVGLDYETQRKRPYYDDSKILTASLTGADKTLAFPFDHRENGWTDKQRRQLGEAWADFLHDAECAKVSHFLPFELEWSGVFFGKDCLATAWEDTASQAWVLDDRVQMLKPDVLSLEFLMVQHFGINIKTLSPLDRADLDSEPLEQVLRYNGIDSKSHRMLFLAQDERLAEDGTLDVYRHHRDRSFSTVLTQIAGVPINPDVVDELDDKYTGLMQGHEAEIAAMPVARQFSAQVGHAYAATNPHDAQKLFRILNVRPESGKADEAVLREIKHPIARETIAVRKAAKVLSTYVKPLRTHVYPDGMLHPIISANKTRTSRTSSEDPNIQNWTKHEKDEDDERAEVRRQVEAPPGYKIVAIDYSGIQARNVAMESKDRRLVEAFNNRYDIHSAWAENIMRIYPRWVKEGVKAAANDKDTFKKYRQTAKGAVFGSFFGARAKKISAVLGVPIEIAERFLDMFWGEFPDIKYWHEQIEYDYYEYGYVTGLSGYRRRAPVSPTELINTPIQQDESVIVCDAWYRLSMLALDDPDLQPRIMIHDDLTFIWPERRIDELADIAINEMVTVPFEWANIVPIEVEMSISEGRNWYVLKKAGEFTSVPGGGYRELKK